MPIIDLTTADVKAGLKDGSMLVIDVREPHEYAGGHIPGSMLMPLSSFDPRDVPAEGGKRIVFSCAAGVRSLRALEMVHRSGLDLHEHYKGGFKAWQTEGEPVAR